jgi:hypothetical protein
MKKWITLMLTALLLIGLVLPLASCSDASRLNRMDEAERAVAFFALVEENGSKASSLSVKQKLYLKMDIGDMAYEQLNEATSTYVDENGTISMLEQAVTTVWAGGDKTVTYTDEGYMDGMMFTYNKEGKAESKLKSAITWEDYEAFRKQQNEKVPPIQVGEGFCTTMTCKQAEDGTWTATYEGFTEEGMKYFLYITKSVEMALNAEHTLKDVRLTYTADKKLNPVSQKMEFIFEEKAGADTRVPVITAEMEIKGINNTVFSEKYDISDFTEVEDLRMVENFTSALHDRQTDGAGTFKVTTEAEASYAGEKNQTATKQNVTFKNTNGYEFTLDYTQEGYEVTISYRNGSMNTVVREEKTGQKVDSATDELSDFEAQAMVQQLMNSENISALDIIDAELRDEEKGIYRFTLGDAVKNNLNEQYEPAYGSKIDIFRGYIDATVVDGKLMSYTYHVYTTLKIDGKTMQINVDYSVEFSELTEDGEAV